MKPPAGIVETVGRGPDLLLIHGTATDAASWSPLTVLLRDRVRVTTYDRRGTGRWQVADGGEPTTTAEHAADAADVIAGLTEGPAYLCGNSYGATIALELLRTQPRLVRGAVLFEPAIAATDHAEAVPAVVSSEFLTLVRSGKGPEAAENFHRRVLSDRGWALLPASAKAKARGFWRQIYGDLLATAAYRPRYAELGSVDVPVLLLRGGRSRPVFEPALRALAAALPRSQYRRIDHADHWMVGRAWPELAVALADFMEL